MNRLDRIKANIESDPNIDPSDPRLLLSVCRAMLDIGRLDSGRDNAADAPGSEEGAHKDNREDVR